MTPRWKPDATWTGTWTMPDVLREPITDRQRGALVAMANDGFGPGRLAASLRDVDRVEQAAKHYLGAARRALTELGAIGARALVASDEEYPDELSQIDAPPPLLFVRGDRIDAFERCVAIVGARSCTSAGARFAQRLGGDFAAAGFTVVSGLARGIDGAAHRGAIECGRTIAVLGTGVDVCYPAEHRRLAAGVMEHGCLVSEFPVGVGPRAWHFPARNRLISGLSRAVIVVEAGLGSGALITVEFALNQGRDVFACATGPENPVGAGNRALLLDGARIVLDPDQALSDVVGFERITRTAPDPASDLGGRLRLVFSAVTEGTTVDDIVRETGETAGSISAALSALELDGLVTREHGRWSRSSGG